MLENTTERAVDHHWNVDRVKDRVAGMARRHIGKRPIAQDLADRTSPMVLLMLSSELLILINPGGQFGN